MRSQHRAERRAQRAHLRQQRAHLRRHRGVGGYLAAAIAPACGDDADPICEQSFLRYDNLGSPFITNWCRACNSIELPPDMRQDAPGDINFDTLDEIRAWSRPILLTASQATTMPPSGGPSAPERAMLVEWLRCGAR